MDQGQSQDNHNHLSETAIQTDAASLDLLKKMQQDPFSLGKVVIGRMNGTVILALGSCREYHSQILERASQNLIGKSLITSTHPDQAKPLAGVLVQGAKFSIEPDGSIKIFDKSGSFGPLRNGIFAEPSSEVVTRYMQKCLALITQATSQQHELNTVNLPAHTNLGRA